MVVAPADIRRHHDEVLNALSTLATETGLPADRGDRVQADRRSRYAHLGLRTPDRRRRVAAGFSFTDGPEDHVLTIWDGIWNLTDNGDVLFAVLDFYRTKVTTEPNQAFWSTAKGWIDRIDNWAHADDLARLYSYALEASPDTVLPTLSAWSLTDHPWCRRVSVVSLIHYRGKNAVFLPVEPSLELIANCVGDPRPSVHQAVGWVLRELMAVHPDQVTEFLEGHATAMPAPAIRRATERLPADHRDRLRARLR